MLEFLSLRLILLSIVVLFLAYAHYQIWYVLPPPVDTTIIDNTPDAGWIRLRDGRIMEYFDSGDTKSEKVLLICVGAGVSGAVFNMNTPTWKEYVIPGVRFIAPSYPGFGYSTENIDGSFQSWAKDVEELMDHLDVKKFSVLGYSNGGAFCSAVADVLTHRVKSAVLAVPLSDVTAPGNEAFKTLSTLEWLGGRFVALPGVRGFWGWFLVWAILQNPNAAVDAMMAQEVAEPIAADGVGEEFVRAHNRTHLGSLLLWLIDNRPFNINYERVGTGRKVVIFSGGKDKMCPPQHQEYYHRMIPGSKLVVDPTRQHIDWTRSKWPELCTTAVTD